VDGDQERQGLSTDRVLVSGSVIVARVFGYALSPMEAPDSRSTGV